MTHTHAPRPTDLVALISFDGEVFENGATENNVEASPARTILPTLAPDLELGTFSVPTTARAGHAFTFSYRVLNPGAATPDYSWDDVIYLSPTSTFDACWPDRAGSP